MSKPPCSKLGKTAIHVKSMPKTTDRESRSARDDLQQTLQRLGFNENEARAYLALANSYPATAYEIAKRSGLQRANAYGVLRSLEAKGAIQAVNESPVRYAPLDPEDYFGNLAHSTQALCASAAREMAALAQPDNDTFMWFYEGADAIDRKTTDLIQAAAQRIWIKGPETLILPLLPDLQAACERGVQVIIVGFGTGLQDLKRHPDMLVLPHEGDATVSRGATDVMLTMTTDFDGVLISTWARGLAPSASYARNRSIIYVVQTLLLHEIYLAEMLTSMGDEIEGRFGKGLARLRKKYRPPGMEKHVLEGS